MKHNSQNHFQTKLLSIGQLEPIVNLSGEIFEMTEFAQKKIINVTSP